MSKQGRADGSDWYERSIRNRKIAGSNPAQSIILVSIRIPANIYHNS
jgi:hypothetical protein